MKFVFKMSVTQITQCPAIEGRKFVLKKIMQLLSVTTIFTFTITASLFLLKIRCEEHTIKQVYLQK